MTQAGKTCLLFFARLYDDAQIICKTRINKNASMPYVAYKIGLNSLKNTISINL